MDLNILKKIIVVIISLNSIIIYSQNSKTDNSKDRIERYIYSAVDSFRSEYQNYTPYIYLVKNKEFKINITNYLNIDNKGNNLIISFPLSENEDYYFISEICNNIAKRNNYFDKLFAHKLYEQIVQKLIFRLNDTTFLDQTEISRIDSLIEKNVLNDILLCSRYVKETFVDLLLSKHFTPKIQKEIIQLISNPESTEEEALLFVDSQEPYYSIDDTVDFSSLYIKYRNNKLSKKQDIYKIERILNWKYRARKDSLSLTQWLEKQQSYRDSLLRADYMNRRINTCSIYLILSKKYIRDLAPIIEERGIFGSDSCKLLKPDIHIILARLQYKNYCIQEIDKLTSLIKDTNNKDFSYYYRIFEDLKFINTKESIVAISSMLMLYNQDYYDNVYNISYPVSLYIFIELNSLVANLPWNYNTEGELIIDHNQKSSDYRYIDAYNLANKSINKQFYINLYEWVIGNQDNLIYNLSRLNYPPCNCLTD